MGADDAGAADGELLEHVAPPLGDVLLDLGAVLLPDAVRHHPAAEVGLELGPRLLDDEEGALGLTDEGALVEGGVVGGDRRDPLGDAVGGHRHR